MKTVRSEATEGYPLAGFSSSSRHTRHGWRAVGVCVLAVIWFSELAASVDDLALTFDITLRCGCNCELATG